MNNILLLSGLVLLMLNCHSKNSTDPIITRKMNFPKVRESVPGEKPNQKLWLFILAGQSNMAGRGFVEPEDTVSNNRIWSMGDDYEWYYAKEPLHFYEPNLTGLDCGMSFARELLKSISDTIVIGLIPCAVGGSSISQWLNDSQYRGVRLLTNLSNRVNFAKSTGKVKGILWHQGESDSRTGLISVYPYRLDTLFTKFRSQMGDESLPVFIGELGAFKEPIERQMKWDSINLAIRNYCRKDPYSYLIHTDDLKDKGDKVHFDSKSQRILGERYARSFMTHQNNYAE